MLDCLAQFCINGINGMATVGNGIILLAPLKQRDEKEAEAGIGHKNGNTAQASAFFADYRLPKVFKFLFALKNTADKKHKITSNRKNLFYNSWLT